MKPKCYPVLLYSGRLVARTPAFQVGEAGSKPVRSTSLLCSSKHGVCASLLMRNELGSIPRSTANQLGEVVGYGMGLHPV